MQKAYNRRINGGVATDICTGKFHITLREDGISHKVWRFRGECNGRCWVQPDLPYVSLPKAVEEALCEIEQGIRKGFEGMSLHTDGEY